MLNLMIGFAAVMFLITLNKVLKNVLLVLLILGGIEWAALYGVSFFFTGINDSFYLILVCGVLALDAFCLGDLMIFTARALRLDR